MEIAVSVIIPTYLEGRYIEATLSNLIRTDPPIEVIVVDGGSTDETEEIAKHFTKKVYRINERGIAKARNYGARRSSGKILLFLDADVTPPADFLGEIIKVFKDSRVVGATCNIMPAHPKLGELIFFLFYNKLIWFVSKLRPHSRGEFLAVRRKQFMAVEGFDENLPCLEDHDLALRISRLGKFVFISDLTAYETMRRFRKTGLTKVVTMWTMNYISVLLRGRPISKVWHSVR